MRWRVDLLDHRVERELDSLAQDVRQRFLRIVELIEQHGLPAVQEHVFEKKTQRTPGAALKVARQRAKEVKS